MTEETPATQSVELAIIPPHELAPAHRPVYETNAEIAALEADIARDLGAARDLAQQAVARAISCGLRLIRYQKILPTRDFKKRIETTFGEASYRSAARYMKLLFQLDADVQKQAEESKVPRGTTLDALTNSPIEAGKIDAFSAAVSEQIAGKHLTELYRANGVIREAQKLPNPEGKNGTEEEPLTPEEQAKQDYEDAKKYWLGLVEEVEDGTFKLERWSLLKNAEKRDYSERLITAAKHILATCKPEKKPKKRPAPKRKKVSSALPAPQI